jgi:hypothetical protein
MSLESTKDFSDSLINLYENTKEADADIKKPFTYDREYYSTSLDTVDYEGDSSIF